LVDCDPYDSDCNGGWYTNAWNYLRNVAGRSARQSLYSYTAKVNYKTIDVSLFYNQQYFHVLIYLSTLNEFSECKFTSSMIGAKIASYGSVTYLTAKSAAGMESALQRYGPLTVAITVVNSFYSYK
jgi:hypothetical protein